MFRNFTQVIDDAKKLETKDLIVVCPEDRAILIATNDAFQMGLIRPVLVGNKKEIQIRRNLIVSHERNNTEAC